MCYDKGNPPFARLSMRSWIVVIAAIALPHLGRVAPADEALSRLTADKLEAVHQAVLKLRGERKELPRKGPLEEFRANLHVHSSLSHDSRGTIEEIVTAAKRAGTQVLLFTEHPADSYDFFRDGHHGTIDGVLLVPGAEM